jgi:hypothetical protein
LPAIIILGVVTSFEDIKLGKIRNRHLVWALAYGVLANIILFVYSVINKSVNYAYFFELFTAAIISLILGFILWRSKFWSSGDAKLYFTYSFLLPLSSYNLGYIKFMPSLTILINTFIPLAIISFSKVFINSDFKEKKNVLKSMLKPNSIISYLLFTFSVFWIPQLLGYLGINFSVVEVMLLAALFSSAVNKIFQKKVIFIMIIISAARLFLDRSVYSLQFLKSFLIFSVLFMILRNFLVELGKKALSYSVKVENLKEGMILADKFYEEKGIYMIEQKNAFDRFAQNRNYFKMNGDGLSKEDILKINQLIAKKKINFKEVNVAKVTPFAHYMFFGVLLTLLFNGNVFSALFNFSYFIKNHLIDSLFILLISVVIGCSAFLICRKPLKAHT